MHGFYRFPFFEGMRARYMRWMSLEIVAIVCFFSVLRVLLLFVQERFRGND